MKVCVYELNTCDEFLLFKIFDNVEVITAKLGETASDLLNRLPSSFDIFAFHLDITNSDSIPIDRSSLVKTLEKSGKMLINHEITDISKRYVQSCCQKARIPRTMARQTHSMNYPVIVKTNNNYGGMPESLIPSKERLLLGIALDEAHRGPLHYEFSTLHTLEDEVWSNEHLHVERFITNAKERFFRAYFLFNRLVVSAVIDPSRLKKMPIGIERTSRFFDISVPEAFETDSEFPTALLKTICRFISASGAQYGALDVVHDDVNNYYVIDLNLTPHWGDGGHIDLIGFLAGNLNC